MAEQQKTPEFINDPIGHDEDIQDGAIFGRPRDNSSTATLEHNSFRAMEFICIPPANRNVQPNSDYFESSKKLLKSRAGAEYDMRHERRGPALIFNQYTFEEQNDPSETPMERRSSDHDVAAFKNQLERLGFDVQQHVDYKKADLLDKIQRLSEKDHTQNDCILIAIFTHGDYNRKLLAHDKEFTLNEILEKFTDENCPTLKGKPKLFFLEGCQGQGIYLGGKIRKRETEAESFEILQHPDFLIAHPAAHGLKSWRRIGYGSWFIQSLCRELEQNGTNLDILTILTYVSQHVARHETTGGEQQLPCFTSTLTRIVRFDDEKKH